MHFHPLTHPTAYVQVGMGNMDCYERDFEEVLLADAASYYRRKAAEWITEDSCPEYMHKVGAWDGWVYPRAHV